MAPTCNSFRYKKPPPPESQDYPCCKQPCVCLYRSPCGYVFLEGHFLFPMLDNRDVRFPRTEGKQTPMSSTINKQQEREREREMKKQQHVSRHVSITGYTIYRNIQHPETQPSVKGPHLGHVLKWRPLLPGWFNVQ